MKLTHLIAGFLSLILICLLGCERDGGELVAISADAPLVEIENWGTVVIADKADKWGTDDYVLNAATITGDTLTLNVSYSGGCERHDFTLVVADEFLESEPVQLRVVLAHNANKDACEAYPTEDYHFDLGAIKTLYQQAYRQKAGAIVLRLKGAPDGQIVYQWTK